MLIERDWYRLGAYHLTADGFCEYCGAQIPGRYEGTPGSWGPRREPVWLDAGAAAAFRSRRAVP